MAGGIFFAQSACVCGKLIHACKTLAMAGWMGVRRAQLYLQEGPGRSSTLITTTTRRGTSLKHIKIGRLLYEDETGPLYRHAGGSVNNLKETAGQDSYEKLRVDQYTLGLFVFTRGLHYHALKSINTSFGSYKGLSTTMYLENQ